jgi:hypothetical protein
VAKLLESVAKEVFYKGLCVYYTSLLRSRWGPGTSPTKKNLPYEASFCLRLRRGQHHDGASGRQAGAGLLESVSWKKEEAKKTIAKLKPLHSSYMSY